MKVIADTSVFIAFFRGRGISRFERLIAENRILLSPIVRLELLQGVKKVEFHRLDYVLGGLEPIVHDEKIFPRAESILRKLKGGGFLIGIADLVIAAEAQMSGASVYSYDKIFQELERRSLIPGVIWE